MIREYHSPTGEVVPYETEWLHRPEQPSGDISRQGREMYESRIRPVVEPGEVGRVVAIDVVSGAYEVDDDQVSAILRLLAREPDARIWSVRVGFPALLSCRGYVPPSAE